MEELAKLLKQRNLTISSCESVTAGLFCAKLAEISGASAFLQGGIVTYATRIKEEVVHVAKEVIDTFGVVSEACALEMAQHTRTLMKSDICVSFTGNAGPDCLEEKPAGYICCAMVSDAFVKTFVLQLHGERNTIRKEAISQMCEHLKAWIIENDISG